MKNVKGLKRDDIWILIPVNVLLNLTWLTLREMFKLQITKYNTKTL